jgi:hypothetical protein
MNDFFINPRVREMAYNDDIRAMVDFLQSPEKAKDFYDR